MLWGWGNIWPAQALVTLPVICNYLCQIHLRFHRLSKPHSDRSDLHLMLTAHSPIHSHTHTPLLPCMSVTSCLNKNGMIRTSHCQRDPWARDFTEFSLSYGLIQSLDWVLMTVAAGPLGQNCIVMPRAVGSLPPTLSCICLFPPPAAVQNPWWGWVVVQPLTAPLLTGHSCSLLRHSEASPSSCLPNLQTKGQCKGTNYVYPRAYSFTPCSVPLVSIRCHIRHFDLAVTVGNCDIFAVSPLLAR